jgi:hypothetical protein
VAVGIVPGDVQCHGINAAKFKTNAAVSAVAQHVDGQAACRCAKGSMNDTTITKASSLYIGGHNAAQADCADRCVEIHDDYWDGD